MDSSAAVKTLSGRTTLGYIHVSFHPNWFHALALHPFEKTFVREMMSSRSGIF